MPEPKKTNGAGENPDPPNPDPPPTPSEPGVTATVEEHAVTRETPDWLFAAAKHQHRWLVGQSLSAADYAKAIQDTEHGEVK